MLLPFHRPLHPHKYGHNYLHQHFQTNCNYLIWNIHHPKSHESIHNLHKQKFRQARQHLHVYPGNLRILHLKARKIPPTIYIYIYSSYYQLLNESERESYTGGYRTQNRIAFLVTFRVNTVISSPKCQQIIAIHIKL